MSSTTILKRFAMIMRKSGKEKSSVMAVKILKNSLFKA